MKKLLFFVFVSVSCFAWDCSVFKNDTGMSNEAFCKRCEVVVFLNKYDEAVEKLGFTFSEANSDFSVEMMKVFVKNKKGCYETCLEANTVRY